MQGRKGSMSMAAGSSMVSKMNRSAKRASPSMNKKMGNTMDKEVLLSWLLYTPQQLLHRLSVGDNCGHFLVGRQRIR